MILKATDTKDNEITLYNLMKVTLNQDVDVPADELVVVIPYYEQPSELVTIEMLTDDNNLIFSGVVDEQLTVIKDDGCAIKITARSKAALLLDNEAIPANYRMPTDYLIYSKYVSSFNIDCADIKGISYRGDFTVSKGDTHWQALNSFCRNLYGKSPKITSKGVLYMGGLKNDEVMTFSNSDENGRRYMYLSENIKRCNIISNVLVKTSQEGGYDVNVESKEAKERKINSRRIVNGTLYNTPMSCADRMIERSIEDSYQIVLTCDGCLADVLGASAVIKDFAPKVNGSLYISRIKYTLSAGKEATLLVLSRKNSEVC